MFSLDTIFISLTFLILSGVLIKIRSSKAIIPLALIYIFFLFNKLSIERVEIDSKFDDNKTEIKSIQPQIDLEKDNLSKNNQVQILTNKDVSIDQKKIADKKELGKKSNLKKEKEKKVKKEKNIKTKINEPKKVSEKKKEDRKSVV